MADLSVGGRGILRGGWDTCNGRDDFEMILKWRS